MASPHDVPAGIATCAAASMRSRIPPSRHRGLAYPSTWQANHPTAPTASRCLNAGITIVSPSATGAPWRLEPRVLLLHVERRDDHREAAGRPRRRAGPALPARPPPPSDVPGSTIAQFNTFALDTGHARGSRMVHPDPGLPKPGLGQPWDRAEHDRLAPHAHLAAGGSRRATRLSTARGTHREAERDGAAGCARFSCTIPAGWECA